MDNANKMRLSCYAGKGNKNNNVILKLGQEMNENKWLRQKLVGKTSLSVNR